MDTTSLSILIGAISAAVTGLLTFVSTKGVDAYLKLAKDHRETTNDSAQKEEHTLRFIIERQDAQIRELQIELNSLRLHHSECEKKHEALKVRLELLEQRVTKEVEHHKQNNIDQK